MYYYCHFLLPCFETWLIKIILKYPHILQAFQTMQTKFVALGQAKLVYSYLVCSMFHGFQNSMLLGGHYDQRQLKKSHQYHNEIL